MASLRSTPKRFLAALLAVWLLAAALPLTVSAKGVSLPEPSYGTVYDAGTILARELKTALGGGLTQKQTLDGLAGMMGHALNVLVEYLFRGVAAGLNLLPRSTPLQDVSDYQSANIPAGTAEWRSEPAPGAAWRLGYDKQLLTPADLAEKAYYKGGSGGAPWGLGLRLEGKYDDLYVRTVAMDDGRGTVVFAVIDCVGISNADVRNIRAALTEYAAAHHIISVNVSATHTHSAIDTQGVWGLGGVLRNDFLPSVKTIFTKGLDALSGLDPAYMARVTSQTVLSVRNACEAMTEGTLWFAKKSTLQSDGSSKYFMNRNDKSLGLIDEIYRLRFEPDAAAKAAGARPILMANFGVHPETVGVIDEEKTMSADFIPYMDAVVSAAGYDFLFLQGAIGEMISPQRGGSNDGLPLDRIGECRRFGEELGYFVLGMTLTEAECVTQVVDHARESADVAAAGDAYTPWYENWTKAEETPVEPLLNIRHKELLYYSGNSVVQLFSNLQATSNTILKDRAQPNKVVFVTEVGCLQLGKHITVFLSPGETAPELVLGGKSLEAATSFRREDFPYAPLQQTVCPSDEDTLLVFDLINDAAGYITPDSDYGIVAVKYRNSTLVFGTVDIMYSLGYDGASKIVGTFLDVYSQK
ncbi:MAG: hypothetical protein LBJ11_07960 [Oscillospiraceae bacterium]|jgi:hypothetical protein|nr:hypothetical protein [Oscillospiraceae bacterium]